MGFLKALLFPLLKPLALAILDEILERVFEELREAEFTDSETDETLSRVESAIRDRVKNI